jgi:hypothetical protein
MSITHKVHGLITTSLIVKGAHGDYVIVRRSVS